MNQQVIPLMGMPGVKLTNTSVRENLTDSSVQFDTLKALYNRYQPDGIFTFMDLTVEAENLGLKIHFPENEPPSVLEHPIKNLDELNILVEKYPGFGGRMSVFTETVMKLKDSFSGLIGSYVIGPFTLAGELAGVNEILSSVILEPDFVNRLVDFSKNVIIDYSKKLIEAGSHAVCILEPTAMMLSPEMFEEYSLKPLLKIIEKTGYNSFILHICGNTSHLIDSMVKSGVLGLSLDSSVDFKSIIQKIPLEMKLIGNIDPVGIFLNGNKNSVSSAVKALGKEMKDYPNFVFSSGCDLPIDTPLENIAAFMKAAGKNI